MGGSIKRIADLCVEQCSSPSSVQSALSLYLSTGQKNGRKADKGGGAGRGEASLPGVRLAPEGEQSSHLNAATSHFGRCNEMLPNEEVWSRGERRERQRQTLWRRLSVLR